MKLVFLHEQLKEVQSWMKHKQFRHYVLDLKFCVESCLGIIRFDLRVSIEPPKSYNSSYADSIARLMPENLGYKFHNLFQNEKILFSLRSTSQKCHILEQHRTCSNLRDYSKDRGFQVLGVSQGEHLLRRHS